MTMMKYFLPIAFCLFMIISSVSMKKRRDIESVAPEYLDSLLREENYEEFGRLMGLSTNSSRPRNANADGYPLNNLFFGDILLTPEQTRYVQKRSSQREAREVLKLPFKKWSGDIPYYVNPDYSRWNKRRISEAIGTFNDAFDGCSRWIPYANHTDYVYIFSGRGCFSMLGYIGLQQPLSLAKGGCLKTGIILHELNHAIGMIHEHSRPDRKDFIKIIWENIAKDKHRQFEEYSEFNDIQKLGPYDFYSVMHYAQKYGKGPKFQILDSSADHGRVGQREGFSNLDILKIRVLYCKRNENAV